MKRLQLPLTKEDIAGLRAGDEVLLTGPVYTGRDAAHKRLTEAMARGEELPVDLRGQTIYYVGPAPAKPGQPIGPAGLGGSTTALGVHVEWFPTHIAGLPVAVNICCHAYRHGSVTL